MPTDVVMPQMGESIAEGTIVRWIKKVGDRVERDEPLFEISTDKVDAEIPSPAAGVVAEIRAAEGATVPVNSVVAVIGAGAVTADSGTGPSGIVTPAAKTPVPSAGTAVVPAATSVALAGAASGASVAASHAAPAAPVTREEVARARSSPLVRKMAAMHQLDLAQLRGTGLGGRVTKHDVLAYLEASQHPSATSSAVMKPSGLPGTTAPMSVMRKKIAEHMLLSRRTSAHVHSVFEVNFGRVAKVREQHNAVLPPSGVRLTYLPFVIKAAGAALRAVPIVNASVDGDNIVYHQDVNVGVAVALEWGLIVPVIRHADRKSLRELSLTLVDMATRARTKQLKPDEVSGGTFTVTNPGMLGAQFGLPIINQPQLAILAVGAIEKRVTVIDDAIAIRPMAYLSLGFDHRVIDGAVADQFLSVVKQTLEKWEGEG